MPSVARAPSSISCRPRCASSGPATLARSLAHKLTATLAHPWPIVALAHAGKECLRVGLLLCPVLRFG
jgi:hypothetical protein